MTLVLLAAFVLMVLAALTVHALRVTAEAHAHARDAQSTLRALAHSHR